jgi:hypothetical protein
VGSFAVVQGAALQREYRALVLGRDLPAPVTARLSGRAGPVAGTVSCTPAPTTPAVKKQLDARRIKPYAVHVTGLAPAAGFRLDFSSGPHSVALDTYTLPDALPVTGLTVAVGTCFYDGYKMAAKLGAALAQVRLVERAALQFWGGDNIYGDVPTFSGKNSAHGHFVERYLSYLDATPYSYARSMMPNYTAYDDHEFWNNYPESQLWLSQSWDANHAEYSSAALDCLQLFQASVNPNGVAGGRSFEFSIPPVHFFFADMRSARTRHGSPAPRMMTPGDFAALLGWAQNLKGPGVLVVGQPLWCNAGGYTDYNPPDFIPEYQAIWRALRDAPYDVLVVTGDVHHSRVLAIDMVGNEGRKLYEFTTSPASHIPGILATVGIGGSQDRGGLNVPGRPDNAGIALGARAYFGTTAPNTFGLLRFTPGPGGEVSVGAAFVDYAGPSARFAPNERPRLVPDSGMNLQTCHAQHLFTLRRR